MDFTGFDWDQGNREKCRKHGLSIGLIESIFDRPVTVLPDAGHSYTEQRLRAIGQTSEGRFAFIVFTVRRRGVQVLLRPISARYMHKAEIVSYEKARPKLQNG